METRTANTTILTHVAVGHLTCKVTTRLLHYIRSFIAIPMHISIKQFYTEHLFHEAARLDLPTHEDSDIKSQFSSAMSSSGGSVAWKAITASTSLVTSVIQVVLQLLVLFTVLREQQDGFLLMILGSSQSIFQWHNARKANFRPPGRSTARVDVMNISLSHT
jgi:CRISPR/Cas system endoribonuclease Cas6 (RAMP superfamily)